MNLNIFIHIFNMSVTDMQSIKMIHWMLNKVCTYTISHVANTIQLELQGSATLAILILQHPFSLQACIVYYGYSVLKL